MTKDFHILPSIDSLLNDERAAHLLDMYQRDFIRDVCRELVEQIRRDMSNGQSPEAETKDEMTEIILESAEEILKTEMTPSLRPVINATGIVLHTGLGRAPLSQKVQHHLEKMSRGYCNIELDLSTGKRGERIDHVRHVLCRLTGAENALVVNNNAAAVFLALNTLAFGKEAIISRGQLVEIGGSFRIPDVMEKSGVNMREIGTTNKTKLSDYEKAMNQNTAVIVVAHTSNYRIMGFTEEPELNKICDFAHAHDIPVLHDLGAGVIVDLQQYGLPYEPLVQDSLKAGADVVTFSGDKILGGPQAGLIVGKHVRLEKIHRNPIMRVVRCDKLIYAALEETLKLFFLNAFHQEHKTMQLLTDSQDKVQHKAEKCLQLISQDVREKFSITIETCQSQTGSGALPLEEIPSKALHIVPNHSSAEDIARELRRGTPPVITTIRNDRVLADIRTVDESEIEVLASVINSRLPFLLAHK